MLKLFDQDFFKLLIGFLFILVVSFGVFYAISVVKNDSDRAEVLRVQAESAIREGVTL
jgi:hypothetical protein